MDRNSCNDKDVFNANQLDQAELARQYYEDILNHNHQQQHSSQNFSDYNHDTGTNTHDMSPGTNHFNHSRHNYPPVQTRKNVKKKKRNIFRTVKTIFTIYIATAGLVTFSLFIIEESLQTVMFSTWAAKDSKEWPLILNANRFFKKTNATLDFINTYFGWINPFSLYAYDSYSKATNHFVLANEANLAAFATELLVEEQENITLYLNVRSVIHHETNNVQWTELDCYKFTIYCNSTFNATPGNVITFNGFITKNKNQSGQYVASPLSISVFKKQNSRD